MSRIAGITVQKTASGKVSKITFDVKKWGHLLEDVLDAIAVEKAKASNDFTPWEEIKERLDKKHGIKR